MEINKIIYEIARNGTYILTREDAEDMLLDICEREHAGCNFGCPIFTKVVAEDVSNGCPYFKNGKKMFQALLEIEKVKGEALMKFANGEG